nr:MAG TPA: protein of unknown function (DUF5463) [Caudoviricetes sp.]
MVTLTVSESQRYTRENEELCTEAHDRREEEHDRHQPDGESGAVIFQRWLLVYCCRIVRRIDGRQCCLRCCD